MHDVSNTDTQSHWYTNRNPHSDATTTHTDSNSAPTDSHTYANCNSAATDSYANCNNNPDTYSYGNTNTGTDYSLSTIPDDRPYEGSQHTVQFHSPGKSH